MSMGERFRSTSCMIYSPMTCAEQPTRSVSRPTSHVPSTADSSISTPAKLAEKDFVFDTDEDF